MIIVIGRIRSQAGSEQVVEEAARTIIEHTRHEPGVLTYEFFQDPDDRRSFTIVEVWADAEVFASHGGSEHLKEFRSTTYPVLEVRDVQVFDAEPRTPR